MKVKLISFNNGEKHKFKERVNKKDIDSLKSYLESINDNFLFNIKIIKWDAGTERHTGLAHGRKIYSAYGGFDTEYAPYELYKKDQRNDHYYFKDTAFTWIDEKSSLAWSKIGPVLQET